MSFLLVLVATFLYAPLIFNAMDGVEPRQRDATFWWGIAVWALFTIAVAIK